MCLQMIFVYYMKLGPKLIIFPFDQHCLLYCLFFHTSATFTVYQHVGSFLDLVLFCSCFW